MRMRVELVLSWGGEDVEKLRTALSLLQPGAVVTVVETREDGSPRIIRWEHSAPSAYGRDCFTLWDACRSAVCNIWGKTAADCDLDGAAFEIYGDTGKRLGRIEGTMTPGGWRHLVDGEPIHCGDALDLLMPDGTWLKGRYEMDRLEEGLPVPLFCTRAFRGDVTTRISDVMVIRRPQR